MNLLSRVAVVIVALVSNSAGATVISISPNADLVLEALITCDTQCAGNSMQYSAAADTLSITASFFGPGDLLLWFDTPSSGDIVVDLVGTELITAQIDDHGNVLGGSFVWFAQSAALGIDFPQIIMSGTIQGAVDPIPMGFAPAATGFYASLDYVNPSIAAHTTMTPNVAVLSFLIVEPWWYPDKWGGPVDPDIWKQDFSGAFVEPFIFGYHTVPEPGTLALLGIGLAGMGFARRRRKV